MEKIIMSNMVGVIALLFWIISLQANNKSKILKLQLLASIFYTIQYFIIGGISAGIMSIISLVRYAIFYRYIENKKNIPTYLLFLFSVLILIVRTE